MSELVKSTLMSQALSNLLEAHTDFIRQADHLNELSGRRRQTASIKKARGIVELKLAAAQDRVNRLRLAILDAYLER